MFLANLSMQTPLPHVNYSEYYGRFFRQFLRDLFKLGSGQVIGALLTIAIVFLQIHYGVIPRSLTPQAVASIGWPYLAVVIGLCLLSAFRAPAQLDAIAQADILQNRKLLALPDEEFANHIRKLLSQVSEDAKRVLRFIVRYEVIERREIKIDDLSWNATDNALRECISATLLRADYENADGFAPIHVIANLRSYYHVPQECRETLKRLLYYSQ